MSRTRSKPVAGDALAKIVEKNVSALVAVRTEAEKARGMQEHLADYATRFAGSLPFVYLHVLWFAVWITWNTRVFPVEPFDPYPFGMLTTIVSLEAIFLSTFVLITQNRDARVADQRADLDVQINLLAEHEVTHLLRLADAIATKLGVDTTGISELQDLEQEIRPKDVIQKLEELEEETRCECPDTEADRSDKNGHSKAKSKLAH